MDKEQIEKDPLYDVVKRCMSKYDYLDPMIFDENQKMKDDMRLCLLEVGNFLENQLRDLIPDLEVDDIVLQGGGASYIREEDCDIDIHLICHSPSLKESTLTNIFKVTVAYLYKVKEFCFDFKGRYIDYLVFPSISGVNSGTYSVRDNKWVFKPIKKDFSFSTYELYDIVNNRVSFHEDFINSLTRDDNGDLSLEECKKIEVFINNMAPYFMSKAAAGDKEYEMEFQMFRVLKKSGEMRNLRKFHAKVYNKAMSRPNVKDK